MKEKMSRKEKILVSMLWLATFWYLAINLFIIAHDKYMFVSEECCIVEPIEPYYSICMGIGWFMIIFGVAVPYCILTEDKNELER